MNPCWTDPERRAAALDRLLPLVEKPTRYLGGEWNSVTKPPSEVETSVVLAFPDLYEIGMSHLGFRILYALLNGTPGVAAERCFMPWTDMLERLRGEDLPLTTLESRRPLRDFDLVGFSMQYELTITNVLAMLERGGIPLLADERRDGDPLVLGGGPVIFNPEPFAPFFDLILAGDAEEALPEAIALRARLKRENAPRAEIVAAIAREIPGWYAPALYDAVPEPLLGMLIPCPKPGSGAPERVKRRIVYDLDRWPFPEAIVVPHAEIVHDRVSWEIMRGCPVGCRFCQAGYVYRPTRERDPQQVKDGVERSVVSTGYDEFSLTSLNTGEYGAIEPLLTTLMDEMEPRKISVGLSSLHATTMTESLAAQVKRVRKTGFTIAPEAGSQRLRNVINKNLAEEDILKATGLAFEAGWQLMKLYFMIGLPTETDEDVDALVALAGAIARQGRGIGGKRVRVTLSASTFVPKPFTPFQWFGMDGVEAFRAKQSRIRRQAPKGVEFRHHDHASSWLEGVLSRADRSLAPAILEAFRRGAMLDSWSEGLDLERWRGVFADLGIDAEAWATRPIPLEAELPWEVIDPLVRRRWLEAEYRKSLEAATMATCADACSGCAPFSKECVRGEVAERRWDDLGVRSSNRIPAFSVERAPAGRNGEPAPAEAPPAAAPRRETLPAAPEPVVAVAPEPVVAAAPEPPLYRWRARFEKAGRSRFLGHLDLVRALTMALRRAGVQVAYSQGFKPHPKVSLSPALSLGVSSRGEFIDFETQAPLDGERFLEQVNRTLPEGIRFTAVVPADLTAPSLQEVITRAVYRAVVPGASRDELAAGAEAFLARSEFPVVRARKGKPDKVLDLRPMIEDLGLDGDGRLLFTLVLDPNGSPRLPEVLTAVAGPGRDEGAEIERVGLYAREGGKLLSPLVVGRRPRATMA
jgi:radical SAM family uncharacterized protein/radical SAM-linked protein